MNRLSAFERGHGLRLSYLAFLMLTLAGCGGGSSSSSGSGSVTGPSGPAITSVSPGYAMVGSADLGVEATGSGFTKTTTLDWNGTALVTTYVSSTQLEVTVPSADLVKAGQYPVTAVDANGASSAVQFRVDGPLTIASLSPSAANIGAVATQLTVNGTGFVPDSVVDWNGKPLVTAFVSVTKLQASIPTSDLSAVGTGAITVSNSTENKGNSSWPLGFAVGYSVVAMGDSITDMVWDPSAGLIYASVGSNSSTNANSLLLIDPIQGKITSTVAAGNGPDALAISDDSQFLYVGLDGDNTVQRYTLPGFTPDINIPLDSSPSDSYYALALAVAPGTPHTVAISRGELGESPPALGPVSIYDDINARSTTVPQPTNEIFNLQWGADASTLYSGDGDTTTYEFYVLGVTVSGVSVTNEYANVFDSPFYSIHYDSGTGLVYADNGQVVDPSSGTVVGSFSLPSQYAVMIPDSADGKAFFAYTAPSTSLGMTDVVVESFNITTHAPIAKFTLPGAYNTMGAQQKLILWGSHGLALKLGQGGPGTLEVIESSTFVN